MSPKEISEIFDKLFSDEGYIVNGFKIKSKSPLIANIENKDKLTEISFGSNPPKAEITRIITLYAYVEGLVFGETGGSVKLRNFPDLSFSYEGSVFSVNPNMVDSEHIEECVKIEDEICSQYSSERDRKIANKCLQYAKEWATICHQSGVTFANADYADRYVHYNNCYDFVEENIQEDVEKRYGSVILTWLFVYVVLPMIIKWIVNKVLERLYN